MEKYLVSIVLIIILSIATLLFKKLNGNDTEEKSVIYNHYIRKQFMSNIEMYFFEILKELEKECNVKIQAQISLSSIIEKTENKQYKNELNRVVDFAIFTSNYYSPLLLIEINDFSHSNPTRAKRDKKVKDICASVGIKLITFYTNKPNKKEYVKNRIKEIIEIDYNSTKNK